MKNILQTLSFVMCLGAFPVEAQDGEPVQMDELMCVHLVNLTEDEFGFLLIWLDGYFNHMHGTAQQFSAKPVSSGSVIWSLKVASRMRPAMLWN